MNVNVPSTDRSGPGFVANRFSRRHFARTVTGLGFSAAAGPLLASCVNNQPSAPVVAKSSATEPPPETTTIRLPITTALCLAPLDLAEDLLKSEGFATVQRVDIRAGTEYYDVLKSGGYDLVVDSAPALVTNLDDGYPIVVLSGAHGGCYELFGHESIRAIRDLKGKTVAVPSLREGRYVFVSSMAASVGLDPKTDINWVVSDVTNDPRTGLQLFEAREVDAFIGFPPEPQELRAKGIGHVVVNTAVDRPWSQYFCCMVAGSHKFVQEHPVATKRALRAILRAIDACASEPERAARLLLDRNVAKTYDVALRTMSDIPYNRWRDFDAADTLRYYALRTFEAGLIKIPPDKLIAQGTNWQFFNELKTELKG